MKGSGENGDSRSGWAPRASEASRFGGSGVRGFGETGWWTRAVRLASGCGMARGLSLLYKGIPFLHGGGLGG